MDIVSSVLLMALACFVINEALNMPAEYGTLGPGFFPKLLGGSLAALALCILLSAFMSKQGGEKQESAPRGSLLVIMAVTLMYLVLLPLLGFLVVTPVYLAITGLLISDNIKKHYRGILINGVVSTILLYFLFVRALNVPLP
jgi:cell division protein FtsW (lipid II flippase)